MGKGVRLAGIVLAMFAFAVGAAMAVLTRGPQWFLLAAGGAAGLLAGWVWAPTRETIKWVLEWLVMYLGPFLWRPRDRDR